MVIESNKLLLQSIKLKLVFQNGSLKSNMIQKFEDEVREELLEMRDFW